MGRGTSSPTAFNAEPQRPPGIRRGLEPGLTLAASACDDARIVLATGEHQGKPVDVVIALYVKGDAIYEIYAQGPREGMAPLAGPLTATLSSFAPD